MGQRSDDDYLLSDDERACFARDGYVHLPGFMSEPEVAALERVYERFLRREIHVEGRDFCDMSSEYGGGVDDFAIVNVMLPGTYEPSLRGSVYERRAASVSAQLCGDGMALDYDQLVAKRPQREDAVFAWHQDLAYWPITKDQRTASFWLAIDATTVDNGCLCFVPGVHREPELRLHAPLDGDRDKSHTLVTHPLAHDQVRPVELARGDVTVHHERALHGSQGNATDAWRRGWVLAFRAESCIEAERAIGFTHSHNDDLSVLRSVGRAGDAR